MTITSGTRGNTALLDRPVRKRTTTLTPSRSIPQRRRFQHTPGSKQVVSVRGRRVVAPKARPGVIRFASLIVALLVCGVVGMMALSGTSTKQTFRLQQLRSQDTQLANQLETLRRDVEDAKSAAEVARQASENGFVVAEQPGVLVVQPNGAIEEQRVADPGATRPIVDVNGRSTRSSNPASSNPSETREVSGNLEAIPNNDVQVPAQLPAVTPYAPTVRNPQAGR